MKKKKKKKPTAADPGLSKYYFHNKSTKGGGGGALSGPEKLKRGLEKAGRSTDKTSDFYLNDATLRQFYGVPRETSKNVHQMRARFSLQVMHCDLVDMTREEPSGRWKYILLVNDCYSRYVFCTPLERRETSHLKRGFLEIFKKMRKFRLYKFQDKTTIIGDLEFVNAALKTYLKTIDGGHILKTIASSRSKAFLTESFIRTLRKMFALLKVKLGPSAFKSQGGWSSFLERIVSNYNDTYQVRLKDSPSNVILMSAEEVRRRTSNLPPTSFNLWVEKTRRIYATKIKKYLNQYVRLVLVKQNIFTKASSMKKIGRELFKVVEVSFILVEVYYTQHFAIF